MVLDIIFIEFPVEAVVTASVDQEKTHNVKRKERLTAT